MKELPITAVLAVEVLGLATVAMLDRWRLGSFVMGMGLLLAAVLRLTLPARQAGLLVVRTKAIDAAVLLTLGFALVALANSIPTSA